MKWFQFIPQFFLDAKIWQSSEKLHQQCNICGFFPIYWFPRGHNLPIIEQLKIIGAGRRNVDCPNCASSDRDRLVYQFLMEQDLHPQKILHIAPEKPLFKALKSQFQCEIIAIDNRSAGYKFAYGKHVKQGDVRKLQFADNQFDIIICNHVLEHVVEEKKALLEIQRVLKPGGSAIVQIPYSLVLSQTIEADSHWNKIEREKYLGQWDHVRLYGSDFFTRWRNWGLNVEKVELKESIDIQRNCLNNLEHIILVKK